jgi:hypothetical protein
MGIESFRPDAIPFFQGTLKFEGAGFSAISTSGIISAEYNEKAPLIEAQGNNWQYRGFSISFGNGYEATPASISAYVCIKY